MNIKKYLFWVLMVPVLSGAINTVQKDGLLISAASYTEDEQVLQVDGASINGTKFTSKDLKPAWVEITNNSDAPVCLTSHSVSIPQVQKSDLQKKFKSRAILYPLVISSIACVGFGTLVLPHIGDSLDAANINFSVAFQQMQTFRSKLNALELEINDLEEKDLKDVTKKDCEDAKKKIQSFKQESEQVVTAVECADALNKKAKRNTLSYLGLQLGVIAAGVCSWWFLSRFNKQFDLELNKQLLQDVISIEPGQTVKKLIVFDAKNTPNTFELNVFDSSTSVVKASCAIAL